MKSILKPILVAAVSLGLLGAVSGCAEQAPKPKVKVSLSTQVTQAKKVYQAAQAKAAQAKKVYQAAQKAKKVYQVTQIKLASMKELCAASGAVAKYIKGSKNKKKARKLGTAGDMEMRALQISVLAKKLKYGSAAFYAKGLQEAAASGSKAAIKAAYSPVKGGVAAAIKLDANKKVYGKCKCKNGKMKCKKKKKKK
jgi:hypothetical protein